ncbi:ribonuclease HI [Alkalibaculum sp. M08DMB]|uniref:ribonuclease H n=1 Tax=Alkalibaculum sporogenes TaxID=2655001 RepID=A0A6A7K5D2_9FIRM|nr:ribonuclease HI [Alkalibaculum sporogenes]MPW24595.1 ribonuclease HI [Alkalibaculum sporogenes]
MKEITIYTDGGCRGNDSQKDNIGGLGVVLLYPEKGIIKEYKEGFYNTTNNKMELLAVIKALEMLKERCKVTVYSDSAYVVNAFKQGWIEGWKSKGWTRGKSGELKNKELWIKLDQLSKEHELCLEKVKGHSNDKYNNRADELVNQAMDLLSNK